MVRFLLIQTLPDKDAEDIIQHEQNHLTYLHFFDIVFIEVVMVIQWFNPFIHLFNRSLRAVHEYQADEGCLNNGITVISYQRLLMNQVFKSKIFGMTNSFSNPTLIKKRMIMMTKKRSTMLANLKLLMVLPAIAIVLIAFSSCNEKSKNESQQINADYKVLMGDKIPVDAPPPPPPAPYLIQKGDTVWNTPDIMPLYPGGDEALFQFLSKNIKYPEDSKKNGIQGRVFVQFTVDRDGDVEDAKIMKGVSPDLDAEALRVINELPDFDSPGKINGKPVAVSYAVPLSFVLK